MSTHPVHALDPVFEYLDGLIRDQGDILFMVFAYVALAVIVWILRGGLRRNSKGAPDVPPIIIIHLPGSPPRPPDELHPFPPPQGPEWPDYDDRHWD